MKRILPFVIILGVLGVALGSAWAWYVKRSTTSGSASVATGTPAQTTATRPSPRVTAPGANPPHTLGPANAPVTLEEFGDFECPPCALFHPILKEMHKEFGDKVRVVFRQFPLQNHQHAMAAASAAEAAALQGRFWEMHHLLYDNQKTWHETFDVRPIFEGYARQIGINVDRFNRDKNSDFVVSRITEDGRRGRSLGVAGTPTVFLNGREMPFQTIMDTGRLRAAIQAEIDAAAKR